MIRLIIPTVFAFFVLVPFVSYADECQYLAERFAYDREGMEVTDIAKLNKCISDYLSARVSGKNSRHKGGYPPQPLGPPPERLKPETAPEGGDTDKGNK